MLSVKNIKEKQEIKQSSFNNKKWRVDNIMHKAFLKNFTITFFQKSKFEENIFNIIYRKRLR